MVGIFRGRIWKFGDDINTELMIPAIALAKPEQEAAKYLFSTNRPGWSDQVEQGDIIVGGRNFGAGSSRPGAKIMMILGIACLLAESINGLFLRNCVNFGLPALSCHGITQAFEEGDIAEINFKKGKIVNITRRIVLNTNPLPEMLMKIIDAGGIIPLLEAEGCLEPVEP